jgi:hypothetical protein
MHALRSDSSHIVQSVGLLQVGLRDKAHAVRLASLQALVMALKASLWDSSSSTSNLTPYDPLAGYRARPSQRAAAVDCYHGDLNTVYLAP